MPTYEYKCTQCGKRFEQLQRMTEAPLKKCPKCGGKPERLMSGGVGVIFKGSGFYETDYKRKNVKNEPAPVKPAADKPKKTSKE